MKLEEAEVLALVVAFIRLANPNARPRRASPFTRYVPQALTPKDYLLQLERHLLKRYPSAKLNLRKIRHNVTLGQFVKWVVAQAAPAPRFAVVTDHHDGGGPFEFESTFRFDVVDVVTREVLHHFEGAFESSYGGTSHNKGHSSGVQEVVVEGDVLHVHHANGLTEILALPRVLTEEEIRSLETVFAPFHAALGRYRYLEDWSSDVSIPGEAVAKEYEAALVAFEPVASCLDALGLRETPAEQLRWGKVTPELDRWLREDAHLLGKRLR